MYRNLCLATILVSVAPPWARAQTADLSGQIDLTAPSTLGQQVRDAQGIVVLEVDRVDRTRGVVVYRKVRDLKGKGTDTEVSHDLGGEARGAAWARAVLDWARPGRRVVCFD